MKKYDKQLKKFDVTELSKINFGKLEGEKDDKLPDSFFPTTSILELFKEPYNYVLSPKGGGKSSVFRALNEKLIRLPKELFNDEKYSIIGINTAFGFDDDYLSTEVFKEEENRKSYTLSWAVFILAELIKDIKTNHQGSEFYNDFYNKIKKIGDFKDKFQLYDIVDYISQLSFGLSFTVAGQPIDIKPKINFTPKTEKLILNEIFKHIDSFYKSNNLVGLILIDRLDNFVRKESYIIQKNYIQGLIDCIEELSNLGNIAPVLFIRTDLFYAFDIDFEYDKVKERTQNLVWEAGETLNFIVYRLLANSYIKENYRDYLNFVIGEGVEGRHNNFHEQVGSIWRKFISVITGKKKERVDLKRTIRYTIAEKYIRLFFPRTLEQFENKDFCKWIFEYLRDSNGFINPRTLIHYFNELIKAQVAFNSKIILNSHKEREVSETGDCYSFDIFSQDIFASVYDKVRNDELRNIYKILKNKDFQQIFKEINERSHNKTTFNYGDFQIKKLNIPKEELDRLLKYLSLLGYCKQIDKYVFEVPKLYQFKMTLQSIE